MEVEVVESLLGSWRALGVCEGHHLLEEETCYDGYYQMIDNSFLKEEVTLHCWTPRVMIFIATSREVLSTLIILDGENILIGPKIYLGATYEGTYPPPAPPNSTPLVRSHTNVAS